MNNEKPKENIKVSILDTGVKDIKLLKDWGYYFAQDGLGIKALTTSQLRKFFGAVKKIQADFDKFKAEIILLSPKLAYAVGRDCINGKNKTKIKEFYTLFSPLIESINEDKTKFKHFVDVFEAVVAYHKEISKE